MRHVRVNINKTGRDDHAFGIENRVAIGGSNFLIAALESPLMTTLKPGSPYPSMNPAMTRSNRCVWAQPKRQRE
jgi:hypothetical protein